MTNSFNLPAEQFQAIENLSPEQLAAIRANIQEKDYSDDETRQAAAQYLADGGELAGIGA